MMFGLFALSLIISLIISLMSVAIALESDESKSLTHSNRP